MFINEIVNNNNQYKRQDRKLAINLEHIYYYSLCENIIFTKIRKKYEYPNNSSIITSLKSRGKNKEAKEREKLGAAISVLWDICFKKGQLYPTEKPYKLLKRIICLSTK